MGSFRLYILELQESIGHLWWARHLWSPHQTQDQKIQHQPVVLGDEGSKLQTSNDTVGVSVIHVLEKQTEMQQVNIYT